MGETFDVDYFLNGPATGKSNYTDYRWLENRTVPMASRLASHLKMRVGDSLLDFGCARGYYVKALRFLGYKAWGYDISTWAVENCDPDVKEFLTNHWEKLPQTMHHGLAKDCLEHVLAADLRRTIRMIASKVQRSLVVVVPLATVPGGDYVADTDNSDVTHVTRQPLEGWLNILHDALDDDYPAIIHGSYHIPGLKEAATKHPRSCGFFTVDFL